MHAARRMPAHRPTASRGSPIATSASISSRVSLSIYGELSPANGNSPTDVDFVFDELHLSGSAMNQPGQGERTLLLLLFALLIEIIASIV
jgi:hypothetical protein